MYRDYTPLILSIIVLNTLIGGTTKRVANTSNLIFNRKLKGHSNIDLSETKLARRTRNLLLVSNPVGKRL